MDSQHLASDESRPPAPAGLPKGPSLLREELLRYQNNQDRTMESALGTAVGMFLFGVAAVVIPLLGLRIRDYWVFYLVLIVGALFTVIGLIATIVALVRPTKRVRCPSCKAAHTIFRAVREYICPSCCELLRVGESSYCEPASVTCSYCSHKTAVSRDHGSFPCSDCGIFLTPEGRFSSSAVDSCPECNAQVPQGALFCIECDALFERQYLYPAKEDDRGAHDEDWVAGKDARGHFQYARALLKQVEKETPCPPTVEHPESPLITLKKALLSLGEAAADSTLKAQCVVVLPEVDEVYASVLRWELDATDALFEANNEPDQVYDPAAARVLVSEIIKVWEPHLAAREQLETILSDELEASGSIGTWSRGLIEYGEQEVSRYSVYMKEKVKVPQKNDKLREEFQRFSGWIEERGGTTPERCAAASS
jgi:hypothetical protein